MKRLFTILLITLLIFTAAGCNKDNKELAEDEPAASTTEAPYHAPDVTSDGFSVSAPAAECGIPDETEDDNAIAEEFILDEDEDIPQDNSGEQSSEEEPMLTAEPSYGSIGKK